MHFVQWFCISCAWISTIAGAVVVGDRENARPRLRRQFPITNGTSHSTVSSVLSPPESRIPSPTSWKSTISPTSADDALSVASPWTTISSTSTTVSSRAVTGSPAPGSETAYTGSEISSEELPIAIQSFPRTSLSSSNENISVSSMSSISYSFKDTMSPSGISFTSSSDTIPTISFTSSNDTTPTSSVARKLPGSFEDTGSALRTSFTSFNDPIPTSSMARKLPGSYNDTGSALRTSFTSSNDTIPTSSASRISFTSTDAFTPAAVPTNLRQPSNAFRPPFPGDPVDGKNMSFVGVRASGSPIAVDPSGRPPPKGQPPSGLPPRPMIASTGAYPIIRPLAPERPWYPVETLEPLPTGAFPTMERPRIKPTRGFPTGFLPSGFLATDPRPSGRPTARPDCSVTATVTEGRPIVTVRETVTSISNETLTLTVDGPIPSSFSVPSGRLPPGLRVPPGAARSSGAGRPLYPTVPGTITFTAIPPKITTITPKSFCLATLSLDDGLVSDPAQTVLNNNVERPKRPSKGPLRGSFRRPGLFSINGVDFGLDDPPFESDEPVDFGLDDPPFESDEPVDETMRIDESFSSISNAESFVGEGVPIDADGGVASGGADPFFLAAPPFEEAAQTLTEVVSVLVTPRVVIQKSPVPTYSQAKPIDRIFEKPPSPAAPNGNVADSNPGTPASPQEAGVPGNRDDNQSNGNGGNRAPGAGSGGGPRDGSPGAPIGGSPGGFNDVADGGISNLGLNGGLLGNSNPGNANGGDFNQGFVDSSDAVSNGDFDQGSTRSSNMVSGEGAPNEGLRGVFRKINGGGSNPGGSNRGGPNQGGSNQGGFNQGGSLQGSSDQRGSNQGGSNPGGSNRGGPNQGGLNQGGFNQGGFNPGGSNQGGFNQGGSNQGGSNQGGSNQGGSNQGGFNQGGFNQGGSFQGSSNQRGSNQGGFNPGGSNQGGFNPGGSNQGGSNQGGSNQGGSSSNGGGSNEGGGAIGGGFNEGLRGVFRGNPNRGGSNQGGSNAGFAGAFSEGDFRGASEGNGASRGVPGQGGLGGAPNDVGSNDGLFGGSAGGLNENINGGSNENLNGNPVPNERNTSPGAFRPPAPAEVITIDNVPIILQPNNVVIGTRTFTPGASPTDIVYNGQTFGLDASRLSSPQTTVAIPRAANAAPALVTAGGQVFSVGPAGLQAPGLTVPIPRGPGSSSFEYKGQTFRINPSQIMAADRLVDLPDESRPTPPPAFVYNGETFSIDGSRVIAPSTTLAFAGGASTVVYRGQTLTIGPSQIVGPSTTIPVANANRGPITAPPSAITAAGLAFSLGPGAAVIGSNTYSFLPGQTPTTIVYQGTTISIGPNGVAFAGTTIPIPTPPPSLHTVTAGGLTFSVGPSQAVIGGRTFIVGPNVAPTTTVVNGQTISIGPQGVGLAGTTVPLPAPGNAALSTVTAGGLTFVVGPSQAVVGGRTFIVGPQIAPTTTVVKGQTISIGPQGVGLAATTVPLPALGNDVLSTVTAGGLTFAVGPSQAVIGGRTFTIGSGIAPVTTVVNGQTISIGPRGIGLATTTVALPSSLSGYTVLTQGDLTFSLSPSHAVIGGKTYTVGPGVAPITTTINGQRVIIGPDGIGFAGTTAALPRATGLAGASIVTVDGLILTVQPTAVVIDGTTYAIGIGATPTTILVGTETISLGPGGIGLDTTTIAPAPAPAGSTRAADSVGAWCGRPWSGALIGTFLAGIVLIPFWI